MMDNLGYVADSDNRKLELSSSISHWTPYTYLSGKLQTPYTNLGDKLWTSYANLSGNIWTSYKIWMTRGTRILKKKLKRRMKTTFFIIFTYAL